MRKKYNVLDLFCGAGGLSLGFELTNSFSLVAGIDFWEPAIETFRYNHPRIPKGNIVCADMLDVFKKSKRGDEFRDFIKSLGKIDVIIGGPPCQGLSLAGKRLAEDPRNYLFKTFVEVVKMKKPKAFVIENVPGLLSMKNGKINSAIINAFKDLGYNHFENHMPLVLKAEEYGVPQIRRRLFYIGFKSKSLADNFVWPPKKTHLASGMKIDNNPSLFDNIFEDLEKPISVKEAVNDLPKLKTGEGEDELPWSSLQTTNLSKYQKQIRDWKNCFYKFRKKILYNHVAPANTSKLVEMIKKAKPGESVDDKYADSKKWHPDRPGYTVKALGAGGGSTNRRAFHYDNKQPRGSTVRENARIQSFPDWYRFLGSKTNQMSQVGAAVPPLLAKAIAESLCDILD